MTRPVGRPKVLHGPNVNVKLPAHTAIQVNYLAKVKGQTLSQVVRDCLSETLEKKLGGYE